MTKTSLSPPLTRYAWLSIGAALATIILKTMAYKITGSVGLLSDAVESLVNLAAAIFALLMLTIASRPPDEDHPYGHSKAEYFAGGIEGILIFIAAAGIMGAAITRFMHPRSIEQTFIGLLVTAFATLINGFVARTLIKVGRLHDSLTLEADGQHLMTDVWTSLGVIMGVGLVGFTRWNILDPIVAMLVALHIISTGWQLIRRSVLGLMDSSWPKAEREKLNEILNRYKERGIHTHALRTNESGQRLFVSLHVLVPGEWTVQKGHELIEELEGELRGTFPNLHVMAHLEPLEDPASWKDEELDHL